MVDRLLGRRPTAGPGAPEDAKAEMWNRVQLARNLRRPRTLDLLAEMADEIVEIHGDRAFGDDAAIRRLTVGAS